VTLFVILGIAAFAIGFVLVGWCVLVGWWLVYAPEQKSLVKRPGSPVAPE